MAIRINRVHAHRRQGNPRASGRRRHGRQDSLRIEGIRHRRQLTRGSAWRDFNAQAIAERREKELRHASPRAHPEPTYPRGLTDDCQISASEDRHAADRVPGMMVLGDAEVTADSRSASTAARKRHERSQSFILPGGGDGRGVPAPARTVCRRAEQASDRDDARRGDHRLGRAALL